MNQHGLGTAGVSRRRFLQVGYSGLLGMGLPALLAGRDARAAASAGAGVAGAAATGRAKSVIVILLSGGLGQHDSFDMKPDAPELIRGEFKPISTKVPGIHVCEHLPMLAERMDKLAVVRSMSHPEGNHLVAVHHVLTGHPSTPRGASDLDRVASRDDFPCYAAVVDSLRRRGDGIPNGVALPLRLVEGPLTWPGQDAGFLGPRHDPWQLKLDPAQLDRKDDSLSLPPGLDADRLRRRRHLLGQTAVQGPAHGFTEQQDAALAMLSHGAIGKAMDASGEDPRTVERYGKHIFGKSLLLARRLVEAGVPVIQATMGIVQTWDTHVSNFPRLKNDLLPPLDRAVTALLDDLGSRGLLDETLVVMLGEFGRTPKVHPLKPGDVPGRDHWPAVFPAVFAGGGVVGGQVIGKSDKLGAYAASQTFGPPDLAATVYHALGVDPATEIRDRLGRPIALCRGRVMHPLYTTATV